MERKHTCYFSVKCRHCQAFLEELAKSPFSASVQLVCVDPSPRRPPLPPFLKAVPTLVLAGENEPRTGAAVFNWLYETRLRSGGSGSATPAAAVAPTTYSAAPPPPLPGAGAGGAVDPLAWHGAEMAAGTWSDEYSFLEDTFSIEKGQGLNRIERNFGTLLEAEPAAAAAAAAAGADKKGPSQKEQALMQALEALQAARKTDVPSAPARR